MVVDTDITMTKILSRLYDDLTDIVHYCDKDYLVDLEEILDNLQYEAQYERQENVDYYAMKTLVKRTIEIIKEAKSEISLLAEDLATDIADIKADDNWLFQI